MQEIILPGDVVRLVDLQNVEPWLPSIVCGKTWVTPKGLAKQFILVFEGLHHSIHSHKPSNAIEIGHSDIYLRV